MLDFIVKVVDLDSDSRLEDVTKIQSNLAIGDMLIESGTKQAPSGLLISGYDLENIQEYIRSGGKVFLAYDKEKTKIIGYIIASQAKHFYSKYQTADIRWRNKKYQTAYESVIFNNEYVYLDQIGVLFDYQKTGASYSLNNRFEEYYNGYTIITLIISEPIDNIRSKKFFLKNGYEIICDIHFPKYGTINNFKGILLCKRL